MGEYKRFTDVRLSSTFCSALPLLSASAFCLSSLPLPSLLLDTLQGSRCSTGTEVGQGFNVIQRELKESWWYQEAEAHKDCVSFISILLVMVMAMAMVIVRHFNGGDKISWRLLSWRCECGDKTNWTQSDKTIVVFNHKHLPPEGVLSIYVLNISDNLSTCCAQW